MLTFTDVRFDIIVGICMSTIKYIRRFYKEALLMLWVVESEAAVESTQLRCLLK